MTFFKKHPYLYRILWLILLSAYAYLFYRGLAYLSVRKFEPLQIITKDAFPHVQRLFLIMHCALFGIGAYRTAKWVLLPQIPHLIFCLWFRFACFLSPDLSESGIKTAEVIATEPPELTIPNILLLVLYALIPVGFSCAISHVCRLHEKEKRKAGKDKILFVPKKS